MLTEAEKKWLEERENRICKFCIHCPGYINTSPCLDWWADVCVMDTTPEDYQDAAAFEARVAVKLTAGPPYAFGFCQLCKYNSHGCQKLRMPLKQCLLKHARLAVEAEMGD